MFSFPTLVVCPFLKSFCDLFAVFAYMCVCVFRVCICGMCAKRTVIMVWMTGHFLVRPSRGSGQRAFLFSFSTICSQSSVMFWFSFSSCLFSLSLTLPLSLPLFLSFSVSVSLWLCLCHSFCLCQSVCLSFSLSLFPLTLIRCTFFSVSVSLPTSFFFSGSISLLSSSLLYSLSLYLPPPLSLSHFIMSMQILAVCVIISTAWQNFLRLIMTFACLQFVQEGQSSNLPLRSGCIRWRLSHLLFIRHSGTEVWPFPDADSNLEPVFTFKTLSPVIATWFLWVTWTVFAPHPLLTSYKPWHCRGAKRL